MNTPSIKVGSVVRVARSTDPALNGLILRVRNIDERAVRSRSLARLESLDGGKIVDMRGRVWSRVIKLMLYKLDMHAFLVEDTA